MIAAKMHKRHKIIKAKETWFSFVPFALFHGKIL